MKRTLAAAFAAVILATAGLLAQQTTLVPGHDKDRYDQDGNGIPDEGVTSVGHYTSLYAYDGNLLYYWDLGDGRIYASPGISSVDDLDLSTLTVCDYKNTYRAKFENTPFMDSGWIINAINCNGIDNGSFVYLIVHKTDPRYTGDPTWAVWGDWEYHVQTWSGTGNVVQRFAHPAFGVGTN